MSADTGAPGDTIHNARSRDTHYDRNRGRSGKRGATGRVGSSAQTHQHEEQRSDSGSGGPGAGGARNRGRGKGRGRLRGDSNRGQPTHSSQPSTMTSESSTADVQPPQPGGMGVFGARLSKDAGHTSSNGEVVSNAAPPVDDAEAEVCFICASPVAHNSVAPCNHRTCHICSLRMRALYKSKACAHCRTESAVVIFTDETEKRFEDFGEADFFKTDLNLGINYDKAEIFEDTVLLLRYNCPDASCDVACLGWPDLHRHVRSVHHKVMCDLCTRNKKVFTHEHELFTHQELRKHEKFGDDNPGAVDQSGFKGHPECGFCRQRFYGDDELYAHCRDKHERCHVCDRRNGGLNPQYFMNYEALEKHFSHDHYLCLDQECLEKKFVVFDSEMDLKAHQLDSHPNGLSKDARRDARRVDISTFDYRTQFSEIRRGGDRRPRGGRGRDPNADQVPATSAVHQSRAEIAHQRELAIHSAQSVSSRSFGGQLSQPEPAAQTIRRPPQSPPLIGQQQASNGTQGEPSLGASAIGTAEALTPQEQARRLHHAAVLERAASLCKNDTVKMDEFRERISSFRNSSISAGDLIDAFFALFDTTSDNLGKLIKELADIFEVTGKRDALRSAWSDWKAINEDYPSLPGPSGANTTASGVLGLGVGSSRVLKLKSSTAQSSRSAAARPATWKSPLASATRSVPSNAFPSLPSSKPASTAGNSAGPSWLAIRPAASTQNPNGTTPVSSVLPPRQTSAGATTKVDAFPALPPGKKPTSTVFSPGYRGAGVIRANSGIPSANAWGGVSGASTPTTTEEAHGDGTTKKKGNKGKKQVVLQWG